MATDIAARVTCPERLSTVLTADRDVSPIPWRAHSVGRGDAGLAVLCGYLDSCGPDVGWDVIGHELLVTATRDIENAPVGASLFSGLPGLGFAATSLSRDGRRYTNLLTALDTAVASQCHAMAAELSIPGPAVPAPVFDLVSGASGVAAYLAARDSHDTLSALLRGLVDLTRPAPVPRWATLPEDPSGPELMGTAFPSGSLNCGLAHGAPGPLAVLSLCWSRGLRVPGQAAAIRRLARWLIDQSYDDGWGPKWPAAVPLTGFPTSSLPARDGWCYGSAGVARALWSAGDALGDESLRSHALQAIHAVARRPPAARRLSTPTFCHGQAGLLQITLRFANDLHSSGSGRDPALGALVDELVDGLVEAYEPQRPFGVAAGGACGDDDPGLVDGAAGVAAALAASASDVEPVWDRMFLLS